MNELIRGYAVEDIRAGDEVILDPSTGRVSLRDNNAAYYHCITGPLSMLLCQRYTEQHNGLLPIEIPVGAKPKFRQYGDYSAYKP